MKDQILFGLILFCSILLSITSCGKSDLVYDETPFIRLTEISPISLQEFQEKINITIEYQDGDGDLGDYDPNIYALEVLDRRLTEPDYYHILPLAPEGEKLSIKGQFTIELKNTFLLGNGAQETVIYEIKMRDRAGNWSNTVSSPEILVYK